MNKTQYLYNVEPKELEGLLYFDALKFKLRSGTLLYHDLLLNGNDATREFYVWKAIEHTKKLIEERDEY